MKDENLSVHLQSPDFFDAERHPELRFAADEIDLDGGNVARTHDFSLQYDPPGLCPGPCSIDELVIEAATGRKRLAMGLGQGDPLVLETPCLLDGGSGLTEQDGIASEAKDKIPPAVGRDHVDDLGG